jgi:hypothetical protein
LGIAVVQERSLGQMNVDLPIRWPNKPAAPNPAIASQLHSGRHWRGGR